MVSLPICQIELTAKKSNNKPYPKELNTYCDHLRKKRLDLNLSQLQVSKILKVTTDTITNWELNRGTPISSYIPKIISFLGYTPIMETNEIKRYLIEKGITQKELAKIIGIDPTTLSRIESSGAKRMNGSIKKRISKLFSDNIL